MFSIRAPSAGSHAELALWALDDEHGIRRVSAEAVVPRVRPFGISLGSPSAQSAFEIALS